MTSILQKAIKYSVRARAQTSHGISSFGMTICLTFSSPQPFKGLLRLFLFSVRHLKVSSILALSSDLLEELALPSQPWTVNPERERNRNHNHGQTTE